ncbi:uncharacterized protein [Spinacia oleracea]|uniref:Reverse transcriptase domain-containing protein n=1 Tax=Spinacia oleracea TaxID=3562 RepID=A0ABM3RR52_SPIOL|nr:uncharacterized protein LOC130471772 [Spinacia oleracea]
MLSELGFPVKFVNWVMQCLYSVSYSIMINGCPTKPIPAKKGLRQGDPISPYLFSLGMEYLSRCLPALADNPEFSYHPRCKKLDLTHMMFADDLLMFSRADESAVKPLFDAFTKFSLASGLEANLHKSEGSFPFRYLGVPLTTRKLSFTYCKHLIDRTVARIKSWTSKFLSYAGRLQLVKSVRFGIQLYWCQIFVMPKKVMKEIQRICRCFLWSDTDAKSRKASVSWEQLCFPKSCGGWNLKDLTVWNKAAVLKHCWALALKQDRLWVRWIHAYYIQHRDFWTIPIPNGLTWSSRKIWHNREVFLQANGVDQFVQAGKFRIQKMYKFLHPFGVQVGWKRLICNSHASPKSTFIVWLAVQNKLATKDRLISWHLNIDGTCGLCQLESESLDHLFFSCSYSKEIWRQVLIHLGVTRAVLPWQEEVQIAAKRSRSKKKKACKYSIAFIESVYCI